MVKEYLFIIDNKKYDLTSFIKSHPGGNDICYFSDHDVSVHYKLIHSKEFNHQQMKKYLIEDNVYNTQDPLKTSKISSFGKTIINRVREEMGETSFFADKTYYIKAIAIYCLTLILEYLNIFHSHYIYAIGVGIFFALIALNVGHDATHGALGIHKWYHEIFKYGIDWVGGSKTLWLQQHVLSHHAYTNRIGLDNDITSAEPFIVFHPKSSNFYWFHTFQHIFYSFILKFYVFLTSANISKVLNMKHWEGTETNSYSISNRNVTLSLRILYILRILIFPMIFSRISFPLAIFHFFLIVSIEGFILAFLFLVSHNFMESMKTDFNEDWHKDQVESSSTYGGEIAGFITGGLNFQIEHHLFPRMSSVHYPRISNVVKKTCEEFNVHYSYYPNILSNFWSTLLHLKEVGNTCQDS